MSSKRRRFSPVWIVESLLIGRAANAGHMAPDVVNAALDYIAAQYGEPPRVTAGRILRLAALEQRDTSATPDLDQLTEIAAGVSLPQ